ncbi:early nodulin-like protein 17 [Primulina tabacum]|uniref:early nodulin-like protein 17 n=1 Tax=Primulina tabacum TaxID=48773 RepID=UPI003F5AD392
MGRLIAVVLGLICAAVMLPEVAAVRFMVGGNVGWSPNVNYTVWAEGKHFYNGDWLFFVYDRNQMNVLEVNQTDYESCNSDHFLHNFTTGAGRDVVPLNVTRKYYFISGKGFCFSGMKIAINVENPPPPPSSSPQKAGSNSLFSTLREILVPVLFAVAVAWDSIVMIF